MDYRLELLDSGTFEKLTNTICQNLFGMGVISFATGKDGGKDGKFTGTAKKYPSDTDDRWIGKFIIQAKHTANPIASCSDKDFEQIVDDEIVKLKKLKKLNEIDCFILFTNRKYSGLKGDSLVKKIITDTGITNVSIIGKESLNDLYINPNRDIIRQYSLDKHHIPFDFSDAEIKNIILVFKDQLPDITTAVKAESERLKYDYDKIKLEVKNKINTLGEDYYKNEILSHSLLEFDKIQMFLGNPINEDIKNQYFDIAAELRQLITLKRSNFDAFEEIFTFIYQKICDGSVKLMGSKRHVTILLHYMYCECLIGLK